jgi:hypothetical protein
MLVATNFLREKSISSLSVVSDLYPSTVLVVDIDHPWTPKLLRLYLHNRNVMGVGMGTDVFDNEDNLCSGFPDIELVICENTGRIHSIELHSFHGIFKQGAAAIDPPIVDGLCTPIFLIEVFGTVAKTVSLKFVHAVFR